MVEIMMMVNHGDDQVLGLGKEEREKPKSSRQKRNLI
jgi:hypothetical protein